MPPVEWYYAKGAKQNGPVSPAELKRLAEKGELTGDDLVWREGMEDWVQARKVKGLFDGEVKAAEPGPAKTVAASPEPAEPVPFTPAETVSPDAPTTTSPKTVAARTTHATFERSPAAFERSREGDSYHLFDYLLVSVRRHFTVRFVESTARLFSAFGHYGLYVGMAALLTYQVFLGVKTGQAGPVLLGVAGALVLALLQYAATRFTAALERLNWAVNGRVFSTVFLDCFALVTMIGGLVALVALTVLAIERLDFSLIVPGVAAFILGQYVGFVALNPESLNLTISSEAGTTGEAVGIFVFLAKLLLRLVPVGFGVGVASGVALLVLASALLALPEVPSRIVLPEFQPGAESAAANNSSLDKLPGLNSVNDAMADVNRLATKPVAAKMLAALGTKSLAASAALPVLAYLVFLAFHLLIEMVESVLAIRVRSERRGERE